MFCEYGMSTMSTEENGLSISLEHDLSTERNLCSAAVAASAPLCKGSWLFGLFYKPKRLRGCIRDQ